MSKQEPRERAIVIPFKDLTITCNAHGKYAISHIIIDGKEYGDDCNKITFVHDPQNDGVRLELDMSVSIIPDRSTEGGTK